MDQEKCSSHCWQDRGRWEEELMATCSEAVAVSVQGRRSERPMWGPGSGRGQEGQNISSVGRSPVLGSGCVRLTEAVGNEDGCELGDEREG